MNIPAVFEPAFDTSNGLDFNRDYRYIGFRGGRARGASWTIAQALVAVSAQQRIRILCVREIQRSIRDSVHRLLKDSIYRLGLSELFKITDRSISCVNGSEFLFSGLYGQDHTIRSLEGINLCYIEEAQSITKNSLQSLLPTVLRQDDSLIVFAMNPDNENDAIEEICEYDNALIINSSYTDNPYAPAPIVEEAERCKKYDLETYNHIWLGGFNKRSQELVYADKYVQEFVPANDETKYYGIDWGFADDPTVFVVASIVDDDILIHEAKYWYGSDINTIKDWLLQYQATHGIGNKIYADSADTGSGRVLRQAGLPVVSKWGKSRIEDGVRWLRSHRRIVVNTGLDNIYEEFENWKYKLDKRTGDILPDTRDEWNHGLDALRYTFKRLIKRGIL